MLRVLLPQKFYQQETFLLWLLDEEKQLFLQRFLTFQKILELTDLHSLYRISHASFKYVIYLGSPYNKIHFHVKKIEFLHSNNKASIIQHTTQKTNALFCTKSVRLLTNQNFSAKYDTTFTKTNAVGNVLVKATVFDQSVNDISDSLNNQRKMWSLNILPCL